MASEVPELEADIQKWIDDLDYDLSYSSDTSRSPESLPFSNDFPSSPSAGESSRQGDEQHNVNCCWGAKLSGDSSKCALAFVPGRHFPNRFCSHCRRDGFWLHNRVRALREGADQKMLLFAAGECSTSGKGCWSGIVKGVRFRLANNQRMCLGATLVIFDQPVPMWVLNLTDPVFHDERLDILLRNKYSTLIPDRVAPRRAVTEARSSCWGGILSGDASRCEPNFIPKSRKFTEKFCCHCRLEGFGLSGRARQLPAGATAECLGATNADAIPFGCWQFLLGGVHFRIIINNNKSRDVPVKLVIFDQPVPPWAVAVTQPIFDDDQCVVHARVKCNTIIVCADSRAVPGHDRTSNSSPVHEGLVLGVRDSKETPGHDGNSSSSPMHETLVLGVRPARKERSHLGTPQVVLAMPLRQEGLCGPVGGLAYQQPAFSAYKRPFAELESPPCSPPALHEVSLQIKRSSSAALAPDTETSLPQSIADTLAHAPLETASLVNMFVGWFPDLLLPRWLASPTHACLPEEKEEREQEAIALFEATYHRHQFLTTVPVFIFAYGATVVPATRPLFITGSVLGLTQILLRHAATHLQNQRHAFALCGWWNIASAQIQWLLMAISEELAHRMHQLPVYLFVGLLTCVLCNTLALFLTLRFRQKVAMSAILIAENLYVQAKVPANEYLLEYGKSILAGALILAGSLYITSYHSELRSQRHAKVQTQQDAIAEDA